MHTTGRATQGEPIANAKRRAACRATFCLNPCGRGVVPADGENLAMEHRNIARRWNQWSGQRPDSNLLRQDHMYGM